MDDFENQKPMEETIEQKQSEPIPQTKERIRRERRYTNNGSWVFGLVLIILGVIFILQNMNIQLFENWWALFILIPAIASFASAWNSFHNHENQITAGMISSIVFGVILTFISIVFLLNLSWDGMWPIIIILVGISIFVGSFLKKE